MTDKLAAVDWSRYAATSDPTEVAAKIAAEHGLDASTITPTVAIVLRALEQQQQQAAAPDATTYVAPAVARQSESAAESGHATRSRAVTTIVQAAVAHGLVNDRTDPAINLYDWAQYHRRLENLRTAFPEPAFNHAVAVKCNPLRPVLRHAQRLGLGAECASVAEAHHALSLGFEPRRVVYDSPCKTQAELETMLAAGVYINLDNTAEIEKLARALEATGGYDPTRHAHQIGLRINPVVGGGALGPQSTATITSKFGLPWTPATHDRLLELFRRHPWLQGIHVHVGSQGCPLDLLVAGAKRAVAFAREVNALLDRTQISTIDIGGGLPTVYDGGRNEAHDFAEYAARLRAEVPELWTSGFTRIITEFGRGVFVKPGITVSRVEARKDWAGQNIAVVHVGGDQFPRTVYLPESWSHVLTVLDAHGRPKDDAAPFCRQDIAGPLCFSGDFLARGLWLPQIEVGDLLVVHDTGGYTLSMYSKYNSREATAHYAYTLDDHGEAKFAVLRKRDTIEETLAFWGPDEAVDLL